LVRDSIEAHLSIVVAAMAVSYYIEHQIGWRMKKISCRPLSACDNTY
jgi:hypothetical protein